MDISSNFAIVENTSFTSRAISEAVLTNPFKFLINPAQNTKMKSDAP